MFYQNHRHMIRTTNRSIKRYRQALTIFAIWISITVTSHTLPSRRRRQPSPPSNNKWPFQLDHDEQEARRTTKESKPKTELKSKNWDHAPFSSNTWAKQQPPWRLPTWQSLSTPTTLTRWRRKSKKRNGGNRQSHPGQTIHLFWKLAVAELNSQMIAQNSKKRTPWGPRAFITSLLGAGLSMAALAKAQDAQNGIVNLRADSQRVFKAHNVILKDHTRKINDLSKGEAHITDEINSMYKYSLKDKLKREITKFTAVVKDRTALFANVMADHLPTNIIDQYITLRNMPFAIYGWIIGK